MKAGTIQRTRVAALRQGGLASRTRAFRPRHLSTENGHAALRPGATRAYQSDSSSKRPASSVVSDPQGGPLRCFEDNGDGNDPLAGLDNGRSISAAKLHRCAGFVCCIPCSAPRSSTGGAKPLRRQSAAADLTPWRPAPARPVHRGQKLSPAQPRDAKK